MNKSSKQLDCELHCKATASLEAEVQQELDKPDKSVASLLGEEEEDAAKDKPDTCH
tara:strand:+ start:10 stop:177 length:168 start_codon:yes stop_codon:yes gene_type:complete